MEEFWTFDKLFLHGWQNCVLRLQSTNLIMFFRSVLNFFIIFEIWINLFSFVMQNFRRSRQKCFLRVQMTIWWKIGFPLENVKAVSSLLVAKQKNMSHFRWEEFERLSDLHFTCTDDHFEKKRQNSWKKNVFISLDWERKIFFDCCWLFFCIVDKTELSIARALFWAFFRTFLIFLINFDNLD